MTFTAYILDVLTDSVYPARISIQNGVFSEIVPIVDENAEVDVEGLLIPGFIDAHVHIESSMLTPAQFAKVAVRHGTTSVVCDPHEIANVCGIEGIEFMIENARQVPFNFYFTAPSCVPTTAFETDPIPEYTEWKKTPPTIARQYCPQTPPISSAQGTPRESLGS